MQLQVVDSADRAARARALVAAAEAASAHGELVDETERQRLDRLAADPAPDPVLVEGWNPVLALDGDAAVGYASVLLEDAGERATGELVVHPDHRRAGVGHRLLERLEDLAGAAGVGRLSVWARADEASRAFAASRGYELDRRLDVLGRGDDPVPEPALPSGTAVRAARPGLDDEQVIAVLNRAFPGSGRPWTQGRLDAHRALDWFEPAGLLVAETDGRLVGVHWTKRRGGGVGEVHILGLDPVAHGRGLGRALLRAGLRHLYGQGDHEVILWMDHANEPAKRLYTSEGFAFRWADVAYGRDL